MGGETSSRQAPNQSHTGLRGCLAEACDALVSVFFPAGCGICGGLLVGASRVPICDDCLRSFEHTSEGCCQICGQLFPRLALAGQAQLLCRACQLHTYAFERARSFGLYDGALIRAILMLKFEQVLPLGEWFAQRLAEIARREGPAMAADVVVPVPLHKVRQKERGYNQAALISKPLARKLGLPHKALLLTRTRPRPDKQVLSLEERWQSVRGAFATRPGSQVDKLRVLLVDDVLTTGATLDACARALLESGAKAVLGLTVARAARNPLSAPVRLIRNSGP
jgi:ComF family protein